MPTLRFSLLWVLLLCCYAPAAYSQSKQDNADLQRDLATYRRATLRLDYDTLLAFMPPQLLELAPKEQLRAQLEQAFNNDELYMVFDSMAYGQVPPVAKTGEYLYAVVPYTGHMQMHFKTPRDSAFMERMVSMLENEFRTGKLQQESTGSSRYITITMHDKHLLAFKTPAFDSWKFIEDKRGPEAPEDSQDMMLIKMIVPAEVLDATEKK
ncbi:MAG: hypothetical protein IPH12_01330 [Saprospirales bacterium]|nr:hypothetical protein [Saprospirales bacterium]MBK8923753.1 hypothetical protein [Saprospirales bacterium]